MRLSLRTKLVGSMLLLSFTILGVTATLLTQKSVGKLTTDANSYRRLVLTSFIQKTNSMVERVQEGMLFVGRLLPRQDLDAEERKQRVVNWMESSQYVSQIAIYHPKGPRVQTILWKEKHGQLKPPDRLTSAQIAKLKVRRTVFLPVQFGPTGEPYLPIVMTMLKKNKAVYAYLWSVLSLKPLSEWMKALQQRQGAELLPLDSIYVVNRKFQLLLHSQRNIKRPRTVKGLRTAFLKKSSQGLKIPGGISIDFDLRREKQKYLASLQVLKGLGWVVVTQQSIKGLDKYVSGIRNWAFLVGGIFSAFAILVGFFLGGRLAKPVVQIAKASQKVADGQFDVRVSVNSRDEVGDMANSFNAMAASLEGYREQLIEETRIRNNLGRYLSAEIVEGIVEKKLEVVLGGERRKITVIFADIVAFTKIVEDRDPEQVVAILNELFTFFTEIIFKHNGIIDKFIGDCVMAVFGAPYGDEDDVFNAISAADEMKRWLEVGNARWKKELGMAIEIGMGIHTGEALAGNIGSQKRMEYTVIGDTVNVAARLEALARPGQILMTAATAEEIEDDFECISIGKLPIKGHDEPMEIFMLAEE